ncbi:putative mitochondrial protein AtMg00310 [Apium graveolens]|uniref:putative mitochondrial protein AtMg00310 n=1 Tax=Apium graveolens TaxID=4045 RepID=UPI003D796AA9
MERMLARYWWKSKSKQNSGISWMSWSGLSKHKSVGGISFRDFYDFNLAMLAKQGWRFLSKPDSIASKLFRALYFPEHDFLSANLGYNPSFVWRSIWESIPLLKSGVRWMIGA